MAPDGRKRRRTSSSTARRSLTETEPPEDEVTITPPSSKSPSPKKQKPEKKTPGRSKSSGAPLRSTPRPSHRNSLPDVVDSKKKPGRPRGSSNLGLGARLTPILETPTTSATKHSPIKTRRILKANSSAPHCTLCKKPKKDSLKSCSKCHLNYHPSVCLRYNEEMSRTLANCEDWLCPKCIRCATCSEFIDDVHNKECSLCLRAWHGRCFKGTTTGHSSSVCKRCVPNSPKRKPKVSFDVAPSTSSHGESASFKVPKSDKRGRPKGVRSDKRSAIHGRGEPNPQFDYYDPPSALVAARIRIHDDLLEEYLANKPEQPRSRSPSKSPVKKTKNGSNKSKQEPSTSSSLPLALDEDLDLFNDVLEQYQQEKETKNVGEPKCEGKWVYMGTAPKMKALYDSPFPDDVLSSDAIYICPFCMYPTGDNDVYRIHQLNCTWRHPPGNEIYRDDGLSFFEVEGSSQPTYCRNLCLLAKMFISSKTLHHEVATFRFYILTEHTKYGCQLVGYFSKEQNPNRNNNLSCLLTLPGNSRKGYGKLLIDLSYELSRIERKIGSPEHPLSDLGLYAYRGYWRSRIVQYLRSARNLSHTSVKQMAVETRIAPTDIVNQLMLDELMVYVDGNYSLKTGKRSHKLPLSLIRRRVIDRDKLVWSPHSDVSSLDPTKLNYYA